MAAPILNQTKGGRLRNYKGNRILALGNLTESKGERFTIPMSTPPKNNEVGQFNTSAHEASSAQLSMGSSSRRRPQCTVTYRQIRKIGCSELKRGLVVKRPAESPIELNDSVKKRCRVMQGHLHIYRDSIKELGSCNYSISQSDSLLKKMKQMRTRRNSSLLCRAETFGVNKIRQSPLFGSITNTCFALG